MVDREQIRRDAEDRYEQYVHAMRSTEQKPLDFTSWLLAELEQTVRERDEALSEVARVEEIVSDERHRRVKAEAQLALTAWEKT